MLIKEESMGYIKKSEERLRQNVGTRPIAPEKAASPASLMALVVHC
jgi:hypothetical protein